MLNHKAIEAGNSDVCVYRKKILCLLSVTESENARNQQFMLISCTHKKITRRSTYIF